MKPILLTTLYKHRRYIWHNAWNELRYRYAGTGMGLFWNVLHPLVTILLYTIVFSWIFPKRFHEESYVLYLTSGLLAWRILSDTIRRGSNTFVENSRYMKRMTIPAEVYVATVVLTSTLLLVIYYLLFLPFTFLFDKIPGWSLLFLPALLLSIQLLAFGITLICANFRALFPDVAEIINAILPLWLWTLPIIYPETIIPESVRRWLFLNPPYTFIRGIQDIIVARKLPELTDCLIIVAWILLIGWIGDAVNRKLKSQVKEAI